MVSNGKGKRPGRTQNPYSSYSHWQICTSDFSQHAEHHMWQMWILPSWRQMQSLWQGVLYVQGKRPLHQPLQEATKVLKGQWLLGRPSCPPTQQKMTHSLLQHAQLLLIQWQGREYFSWGSRGNSHSRDSRCQASRSTSWSGGRCPTSYKSLIMNMKMIQIYISTVQRSKDIIPEVGTLQTDKVLHSLQHFTQTSNKDQREWKLK